MEVIMSGLLYLFKGRNLASHVIDLPDSLEVLSDFCMFVKKFGIFISFSEPWDSGFNFSVALFEPTSFMKLILERDFSA